MPDDAIHYHMVDVEPVGIISYFYNDGRLKETYKHVRPSFNWSSSNTDNSMRICSSLDGYSIPFYECLFSRLKFKQPFSDFEEGVLKHFKIAPSQLHLVV